MKRCENTATRINFAQTGFVDNVMEQFNFTIDEAWHILKVYIDMKVVKLDAVGGRYILIHGAFWDSQPMKNALQI